MTQIAPNHIKLNGNNVKQELRLYIFFVIQLN